MRLTEAGRGCAIAMPLCIRPGPPIDHRRPASEDPRDDRYSALTILCFRHDAQTRSLLRMYIDAERERERERGDRVRGEIALPAHANGGGRVSLPRAVFDLRRHLFSAIVN